MADNAGKSKPIKRAVIDIGSNSVRLVIYDGTRRAPVPICNEKALCGLGRDMSDDGALNPNAVRYALSTLARFQLLLKEHGDPQTRVIATAAVREAVDGKAFVKKIKSLGFNVEVIEGEREAELAALGVISYGYKADGIVGDMGGGSLELVAVKGGQLKNRTSLSIGPLRLMQKCDGNIQKAPAFIETALDSVGWIKPGKYTTLYSVGGAWRAVARIHMRLRSYPMSVLHDYELSQRDAIDICDLIARQSRKSLEEIPGIPRRRIDTLPFAALVLKALLQRMKSEHILVSAGGVREGLLYEDLSDKERNIDPLLAGATFFSDRLSPNTGYGEAVFSLTTGLFPEETDGEKRLRSATCQLIDTGAFFHPDLRGEHAFDTALRAPFYAISHKDRAAMALSLFVRHQGRRSAFPDDQAVGLLSWEEQTRAVRLGLAMRFAGALAPKAPSLLKGCSLTLDEGSLIFTAPRLIEKLMEDFPRRRLESLAAAFEANIVEIYTD